MNLKHDLSSMQRFVLGLLCTTVIVIGLYFYYGQSKSFLLKPSEYTFYSSDDRQSGGGSTSFIRLADDQSNSNQASLECDLVESSYRWPYCSTSVYFNEDRKKGWDFSDVHTLYLDIDYETKQEAPRLRVYLRNFNPAYSSVEDEYTVKYNGVEFTPGVGNGEIAIPLKNFQVMTWWLSDHDIPIAHAGPEFSNVTLFEIATGSGAKLGAHNITINSIRFEGSYLDGETLMLVLLLSWVVLALLYAREEAKYSKLEIQRSEDRERHLQAVNDNLRIQNHEISEMAQRDALTGARNRHSVRRWLKSMTKNVQWENGRFSMIYLDIDHFKAVNDTFGHQVGDDILREFVMIVTSSIDSEEHLVRWGGEEFIVFCPNSTLDQAIDLAERIRLNVKHHIWVHGEELTCSAGVAEMGEERITETIARADEALYAAKQKGRDRVEVNSGLVIQKQDVSFM
ncbi:GGDEF domain-containing protein [Vibrio tapetis subsp. quintayensis]|uniref:GGDEF domain-containing protein n=1 Tax=Vibrio tapetis TaxID=52443 RepID=UPI0025B57945|nr:GGDEF domain-containing protein [Vibrio tapetis]MDN3679950.1 GGDEF domain-containing protein [Vibrio tapetis subsp. quintayensis]